MTQDYRLYTKEDQLVWKLLFNQQTDQIRELASHAFCEGMQVCGFTRDAIPHIAQLNEILLARTGWQIEVVAGLIPNKEFFQLLSEQKFPASTWLRKINQLDYLEEPDMFHDILGHVPLLANRDFGHFLQGLSKLALQYIDDEYAIEQVSRLYWYTVEFGLIFEKNDMKIYGAGILSSKAETHYAIHHDAPKRLPFQVGSIIGRPYVKESFQAVYFVIESYRQLYHCIEELAEQLQQQVATSNS